MMYVGLDLHKRYSEFAVMDIGGNLLKQGRIENTLDKMREFSESIPRWYCLEVTPRYSKCPIVNRAPMK